MNEDFYFQTEEEFWQSFHFNETTNDNEAWFNYDDLNGNWLFEDERSVYNYQQQQQLQQYHHHQRHLSIPSQINSCGVRSKCEYITADASQNTNNNNNNATVLPHFETFNMNRIYNGRVIGNKAQSNAINNRMNLTSSTSINSMSTNTINMSISSNSQNTNVTTTDSGYDDKVKNGVVEPSLSNEISMKAEVDTPITQTKRKYKTKKKLKSIIEAKIENDELNVSSSTCLNISQKKLNKKLLGKCKVCDADASGRHYNALTCEGCKGFFRRVVVSGIKYYCKTVNECKIERETRRTSCRACRFRRCLEVGMIPSLCSKNTRSSKREMNDVNDNSTHKFNLNLIKQVEVSYQRTIHSLNSDLYLITSTGHNINENNNNELKKINEIIKIIENILPRFKQKCSAMLMEINLFRSLNDKDRLEIINKCVFDICLLHICKNCDTNKKIIFWPNGKYLIVANLYSTKLQAISDDLINLCNKLFGMNISDIAFITVLHFSKVNNENEMMKKINNHVIDAFDTYNSKLRPKTEILVHAHETLNVVTKISKFLSGFVQSD